MARLWEPKADYRKFDPESLEDIQEANVYPEHFLPYQRLYGTLTQEQLRELFRDAQQFHWEVLDLRCCALEALPAELGDLTDLRVLNLGNFFIQGLDKMSSEKMENAFTNLPESIGQLVNLQALYLSGTPIGALPYSIGRLSNLQALYLERTAITVLPSFGGNFTRLKTLILCGCHLKEIPYSVVKLGLPFVTGDKYANHCVNLTNVTLDEGDLSLFEQPREVIEGYYQRRSLQLRRKPSNILHLSDLHSSDIFLVGGSGSGKSSMMNALYSNAVKFATPWFIPINTIDRPSGKWKSFPSLSISKKRQDAFGISERIYDALLYLQMNKSSCPEIQCVEYFSNVRIASGVVWEYWTRATDSECKVIFLGDGKAGKSSLIERIVHGKFEEGALPTDGVKMTKWRERSNRIPLRLNGKPLIIRFLDFGGQEIMHSMHRCFLTGHTVYVVVCESRDDAEIDRIAARWMETVKAFAPGCPVILVLNKSDLNPNAKVNEWALKAINPEYRHMLHTSAKTNDGVEMLENSITQGSSRLSTTNERQHRFSGIEKGIGKHGGGLPSPETV